MRCVLQALGWSRLVLRFVRAYTGLLAPAGESVSVRWNAARPALPHTRALMVIRTLVAPCASVKSFSPRCIDVIRVRGAAAALAAGTSVQPSRARKSRGRFTRETLPAPEHAHAGGG
jgi:hypothetical protein